ncbi:MAG: VWA domain-containing protein [Alphaproteobacteria bacterium]|nr:VWA domain-containing protein [Alphaproteobacteria bacterium]
MSKYKAKMLNQIDDMAKDPLLRLRRNIFREFLDSKLTGANLQENLEKIYSLSGASSTIEQEINNIKEAIFQGIVPGSFHVNEPLLQLAWGTALATLAVDKELQKKWIENSSSGSSSKTPGFSWLCNSLWLGVRQTEYMQQELTQFAWILATSIGRRDVRLNWGISNGGYPEVSFYYDTEKNYINLDMICGLLIGIEHSRAAALHEVAHALGTEMPTRRMDELRNKIEATIALIMQPGHGGCLTKDEYIELNRLELTHRLLFYIFDETENSYANSFVVKYTNRSIQNFYHSANYVECVISDLLDHIDGLNGIEVPQEPLSKKGGVDLTSFLNTKNVIRESFFSGNGLFDPNDPSRWMSIGIKIEKLLYEEGGKSAKHLREWDALKQIISLTQKLEHLQLAPHEHASLSPESKRQHKKFTQERNHITDIIFRRCVERTLLPELLKEQEKQINEQFEQKKQQQEQQQQEQQNQEQQNQEQPNQEQRNQPQSDGQKNSEGQGGQGQSAGQSISVEGVDMPDVKTPNETTQKDYGDYPDEEEMGKTVEEQLRKKIADRSGKNPNDVTQQEIQEEIDEAIEQALEEAQKQEAQKQKADKDGSKKGKKKAASRKGKPSKDHVSKDKESPSQGTLPEMQSFANNPLPKLPVPAGDLSEYQKIIQMNAQTVKQVSASLRKLGEEYRQTITIKNKGQHTMLPEDGNLGRFDAGSYIDFRVKRLTGQPIQTKDYHLFTSDRNAHKPAVMNLVLCIDCSGSMIGKPFENALNTACIFFEAAKQCHKEGIKINVYIYGMDQESARVIAFPDDAHAEISKKLVGIKQHVGGLQDQLSYTLEDALGVLGAQRLLPGAKVGKTHYFILSDAGFTDGNRSFNAIKTVLEKVPPSSVTMCLIGADGNSTTNRITPEIILEKIPHKNCFVVPIASSKGIQKGCFDALKNLLKESRKPKRAETYSHVKQQLSEAKAIIEKTPNFF